jgi:hypothetical protein
MEEKKLAAQSKQSQMMMQDKNAQRELEIKFHDDDIAVKREQIAANLQLAGMREANANTRHAIEGQRIDTDKNGIDDYLDVRRTDVDEKFKLDQIRVGEEKLAETQRANLANEQLKQEALNKKPAAK